MHSTVKLSYILSICHWFWLVSKRTEIEHINSKFGSEDELIYVLNVCVGILLWSSGTSFEYGLNYDVWYMCSVLRVPISGKIDLQK